MTRASPKETSRSVRDKLRAVADGAPTAARVTFGRAEAAAALGIDIQTVDAWIAAGTLRASKPGGGRHSRVLIRAADIEAMLIASAVPAVAA